MCVCVCGSRVDNFADDEDFGVRALASEGCRIHKSLG